MKSCPTKDKNLSLPIYFSFPLGVVRAIEARFYSLTGNVLFPYWETIIPTAGINSGWRAGVSLNKDWLLNDKGRLFKNNDRLLKKSLISPFHPHKAPIYGDF